MTRAAWLAAALGLVLAGCSLAEDVTPPPGAVGSGPVWPSASFTPTPSLPRAGLDTQAGAAIYAEKCAACHGATGLGDGPQSANLPNPPARLGDLQVARDAVPAAWYDMVTRGNLDRFMPGFSSLSDQERWDVVAYALTLSVSEATRTTAEQLYAAECAQCHGAEGEGADTGPDLWSAASFAARSRSDIYRAITEGVGQAMPSLADRLSEDERWALAAFVQQLGFSGAAQSASVAPTAQAGEPGAAVVTPESQPSPATSLATVRGQVVNGTTGGAIPAGLEITLHGLEGSKEVFNRTGRADADGNFRFDGLEAAAGRLYYVSAEYGGVTFESSGAHFLPDNPAPLELPLVVYEATSDLSAARVAQLHLIFLTPRENVMNATEVWVFSNLGDRVVVPDEGAWLLDAVLPEGAQVLEVSGTSAGDRFAQTARGFTFSTPLIPGEGTAQAAVIFSLPFSGSMELSQPMSLTADSAVILIQEGGLRARGAGLADAGTASMAGTVLHQYVAGPFQPGESLTLTLSARRPFPWPLVIGGAALLAATAAAGLWWLRLRRRATGPSTAGSEREADLKETLLRALADLDDAFEAGELEEDDYRARRQDLKRQLMAWMREPHD
ncbi:MAG: c-type cytochrome [Chloroflexota bacterium]